MEFSHIRTKIAQAIAPGLMDAQSVKELVSDAVRRAVAALPVTASYDPKGEEGYRPISGAAGSLAYRELHPVQQDRMFQVAYYMWDYSPTFRRLAKMDKTFIFSRPIKITSPDTDVQARLDLFWNDPDNRKISFPNRAMWLSILGEALWPITVNPVNGAVRWGYQDPQLIKEIYVSPLDTTVRMQVELQDDNGRRRKPLAIIRRDHNIQSKSYGRLVGECFYYTKNNPPNAARGRSDFLTLFDWIDGLERYGFNALERSEYLLNFIWDVTLNGYSPDQIREWLRENPPPSAGSVRAHNENAKWEAVAPDLKNTDTKAGFDMAKAFVLGAHGRPDSWFGAGGKAYQTEADQFEQVPTKDLESESFDYGEIAREVSQFVIDQAVIHGALSPAKAAAGFQVDMPAISQKNLVKLINGVPQLSAALKIAEESKWVTRKTSARIFAFVSSYLGYEVNADKELEEIGEVLPAGELDYEEKEIAVTGPAGEEIAKTYLNGAQIASLVKIVQAVGADQIPRESAMNILTSAFPFDRDQAERILAGSGKGLKVAVTKKVKPKDGVE